jgi:TetR/AcrR family transcriptional regulator, transcriptional repressor for nem operon
MPMDTRERLLSEAERLVRRLGYAGFSYAHLSAAVGLTKASIHHHFPSKEALGLALVATYERRYAEAMAAILGRETSGPARISAYAELYLKGLEDDLGCLCAALAVEVTTLPPTFRTALAGFFEKHVAWLAAVVAEGQADGSIRAGLDPRGEASQIVSTLEGALLMGRVFGRPDDFKDALAALDASLRP